MCSTLERDKLGEGGGGRGEEDGERERKERNCKWREEERRELLTLGGFTYSLASLIRAYETKQNNTTHLFTKAFNTMVS